MSLSDDLERDRRQARRDYAASLMSNAKWRALFAAVQRADLRIRQVVVKFIGVDGEKTMQPPSLETPWAFADSIEFGPYPLVAIEWLEFPKVAVLPRRQGVPAEEYVQDIGAVRSVIEGTGKRFPLQATPTGLRVIGHVR